MVKAYLRYEPELCFGVICSACNAVFDATGDFFICAALSDVAVWNVRRGSLKTTLRIPADESTGLRPQVTRLEISPVTNVLCAGYSDGSIRFWDLKNEECKTTVHGHKGAVTALRFDEAGGLLASGSNDTNVCVWDTIGERGICKLRGHKGQVTDLVFLRDGKVLVSSSKDTFLRVWDLDTQHCCQTVVNETKAEVCAIDADPFEKRLVVGAVGKSLRVYEIEQRSGGQETQGVQSLEELLKPLGVLERKEGERVGMLRFTNSGKHLACQGAGKVVEVFQVQPDDVALKRAKKREKRKLKKLATKNENMESTGAEEASRDEPAEEKVLVSDIFDYWRSVRSSHKLNSFDFRPAVWKRKGAVMELGLSYRNNSFELATFMPEEEETTDAENLVELRGLVDGQGHRSGIRSLCLSSNNSMLMSTSEKEIKLWNSESGAVLQTVSSGYGLSCLFAPGDTYAIVGTKHGKLQIIDLASLEKVEEVDGHSGPIYSVHSLPEKDGFISGGDKAVKFWKWKVMQNGEGQKKLAISNYHTLPCDEEILCLRISPDGRLLAVSLLDSTIKVFYLDSLKLFLTLYGHKLPVLCMDISADNQLLVTGSADKNIKLWGLDFGDCHKSIFAHDDSVTGVAFMQTSHHVFSVGKDKMVKYWDMDKYELLLSLHGHHAEVWCLAVSISGDVVFTGSGDRSIRSWGKSEEPFFLDEEKEKRLESMFEADIAEEGREDPKTEDSTTEPAGQKTLATVNAADSILDALDMAAHETKRLAEHKAQSSDQFESNPLMYGLKPSSFVLRAVQNVKNGDLEMALMSIPFSEALRLLGYLCEWLESGGGNIETIARVGTLLVRLHLQALSMSPSARATLVRLQGLLRGTLQGVKDTMGFNMAGIRHMQISLKRKKGVQAEDEILPVRQKIRMMDE
ncbi:hypothetical protein BSKO_13912 [Bryopsis sp. KO-2023]|nr:hypothetical protein BSKO_13912 [Bryopsis sp. KO-2023]